MLYVLNDRSGKHVFLLAWGGGGGGAHFELVMGMYEHADGTVLCIKHQDSHIDPEEPEISAQNICRHPEI